MAQAQHGKQCTCRECVELYQFARIAREPVPFWREPHTVEQLRDAYEEALNEMQMLVEAGPLERETRIECVREFLRERGREIR